MDIIDKLKTLNKKSIEKFKKDNNYIYSNPGFLIPSYGFGYFQTDVFSKRKTVTTIQDLSYKLNVFSKSGQKKKYLQSEIPYYVFPNHITDLEGNVLFMRYARMSLTYTNSTSAIWLITNDFYTSNHPLANHIIQSPNSFTLEIVNIKDIYEMFFKVFEFSSIKDINNFKSFAKNILEEKIKEIVKEKEETETRPF